MGDKAVLTELLELETAFWKQGADFFRSNMTSNAFLVFPPPTGMMTADEAVAATENSVRWESVALHEARLLSLGDHALLLVYRAEARRPGAEAAYEPLASSVYVRAGAKEAWLLAFHQQSA